MQEDFWKVSKKDQKLLAALFLLLLLWEGFFGLLLPAQDKLAERRTLLEEREIEAGSMDTGIVMIPQLEEQTAQKEEQVRQAAGAFLPMMSTDEIDEMLTQMARSYGLTVRRLQLREARPEPVEAYLASYNGNGQSGEKEAADELPRFIYTAKAEEYTAYGRKSDVLRLVDELAKQPAIRPVFLDIREETGGKAEVTLRLNLYLYNDLPAQEKGRLQQPDQE